MIELIIGDASGDGHSMTDTVVVMSNLTAKEAEKAYVAGAVKAGVDLDKIAHEYEDASLYAEDAQKLIAVGLDPNNYVEEYPIKTLHNSTCSPKKGYGCYCHNYKAVSWDDPDAYAVMSAESFARLYLDLVKLVNPEFRYKSAINDY